MCIIIYRRAKMYAIQHPYHKKNGFTIAEVVYWKRMERFVWKVDGTVMISMKSTSLQL